VDSALIIGGRYLTFATLYDMRIYWAFGVTLAAAGFLLAANMASIAAGAFTGGLIEVVFAGLIYLNLRSVTSISAKQGT